MTLDAPAADRNLKEPRMNKQTLNQTWDHLRQVYGIGLRCVETLPADKLDTTIVPKMRTPKQLVVHMYAMCTKEITDGILRGNITMVDEKALCDSIKTHADLVKFAKDMFAAADKNVTKISDAELSRTVTTPWDGFQAPGFVMMNVLHDEYLHHRGQLYAFLRAFGKDVPMMWDFDNNAAEYRSKMTAQA